jgi:hypothetical protein
MSRGAARARSAALAISAKHYNAGIPTRRFPVPQLLVSPYETSPLLRASSCVSQRQLRASHPHATL